MSKSFSMGVRLFLGWVRDPEFTSIRVLGPSEDHLEQNLFSHLVSLHQHATLPMPGRIGNLFIGLNRRDQLSSIRGVVIPKGTSKKAGRLQGSHRRPRPAPHPIFGPLSRLFIFLDEIENIPGGVWQDIDNVLSEIEKGGQGFKVFGAYNPTNPTDEVGKRAEPPFGWHDLDEDKHFLCTSLKITRQSSILVTARASALRLCASSSEVSGLSSSSVKKSSSAALSIIRAFIHPAYSMKISGGWGIHDSLYVVMI